jgi:hypothetical protein
MARRSGWRLSRHKQQSNLSYRLAFAAAAHCCGVAARSVSIVAYASRTRLLSAGAYRRCIADAVAAASLEKERRGDALY